MGSEVRVLVRLTARRRRPVCGAGRDRWLPCGVRCAGVAAGGPGGSAAAMAGFRVRYALTEELVNERREAADEKQPTRTTLATDASTFSASISAETATPPNTRNLSGAAVGVMSAALGMVAVPSLTNALEGRVCSGRVTQVPHPSRHTCPPGAFAAVDQRILVRCSRLSGVLSVVFARIGQALRSVGTAPYLLGVQVVLTVVFPSALGADLPPAAGFQGQESATGAGVRTSAWWAMQMDPSSVSRSTGPSA